MTQLLTRGMAVQRRKLANKGGARGTTILGRKLEKAKGDKTVSSTQPITWTPKHQQVLEELLDLLVHPPIMAFPDFNLPYVLHTDASQDGLGAVLYQKQNGECERCCEERVFVKQRMAFPGHNSKGRTHDKDRGWRASHWHIPVSPVCIVWTNSRDNHSHYMTLSLLN